MVVEKTRVSGSRKSPKKPGWKNYVRLIWAEKSSALSLLLEFVFMTKRAQRTQFQ